MKHRNSRLLALVLLGLIAQVLLPAQNIAVNRSAADAPASIPLQLRFSPSGIVVSPPRPDPAPGNSALQNLVRSAGIIFSGRVTFVGRAGASSAHNTACTTITFQVEHAMRGASVGQSLTIREWAGLWANGERYRWGERVLLFLYPASRLGFTSPVAGGLGRLAVDSEGRIALRAFQTTAFARDPLLSGKTSVPIADFDRAVRHFLPEN